MAPPANEPVPVAGVTVTDQLYQFWGWTRSLVYDAAIVYMTAAWYERVLHKLPMNATVLDVGIGTAAALLKHSELIRRQRLRIVGVDVDLAYIDRAEELIHQLNIQENVQVHLESIHDHHGGPYDAVYFSGSFMLIPEPAKALAHVASQLRPEGLIYFTQTFQKSRSWVMETIKPLLFYITSIDFGKVTYEHEFVTCLQEAQMNIVYSEVISDHRDRQVKLIVAAPNALEM